MVKPPPPEALLLDRSAVGVLLELEPLIDAVERGFRRLGSGPALPAGVLGLHPPGGGFHVKAAVFPGGEAERPYLAAKLNTNFPGNPASSGLPTIQGLVALFDPADGVPLAVLDSAALTIRRTAAATAVAVKHLAAADADRLLLVGCGAQAVAQVQAVARVRRLDRVEVADRDSLAAARVARELAEVLAPPAGVGIAEDPRGAARGSSIVVTCTPSTSPILGPDDVAAGVLIAAVGADSEHKSELHPDLVALAAVITDDRDQCARIGDLHQAIAAGRVGPDHVRADLGEVVAGRARGRAGADEVVVFDSTGLPFQDVVAAAMAYERALAGGVGLRFAFGR